MFNQICISEYTTSVKYREYGNFKDVVGMSFDIRYNDLQSAGRSMNEYGFYNYTIAVL